MSGATFSQSPGLSFVEVAPEIFSNSFVRCFYKDSKGFLWLGTADGLMRYDGTNVVRYDHNPEQRSSLSHNYINAIVEDSSHRLWIGTAQGISIYEPDKDNFLILDSLPGIKNQLNNRYVTALCFDQHKQLWIGTHEGGVNVFDPVARKFTYLVDARDGEASGVNYVNTLVYVDGKMWCGSKGGLRLFNTNDKRSVPINFSGQSLPVNQVSQLIADNVGNIWLATVRGEILKIIPRNGYYTFQMVISGEKFLGAGWNSLLTLCRDVKGDLWFGGENSGLNHLETKTGKITRYLADERNSKRLASNSIRSVYVDDTGLTWIGTFNKGAYLVDNGMREFTRHKPYRGISDNFLGRHVRSFAEDTEGNVWIAVDGIGLGKIDAKSGVLGPADAINRQLANKYLAAVVCDRRGALWIGSVGAGVYKVDPDTHKLTNYSLHSAGFGENKVSCLYEDRSGTIWAGTSGSGLFYFDRETERFTVLCEGRKVNHIKQTAYVSAMQEDSKDVFWVATMYGLYALTRSGKNTFDYHIYVPGEKPGTISSGGVQSIYEDRNKTLWIGTTDNGLNKKSENDSVFHAFKKNGLASNTVRALVADAAGNLWLAGNMGLSKYDSEAGSLSIYSRDDGLPSNNFYNNACLRSSTGELFFGSNNGFTVFYPDSIVRNAVSPVVYLADLKINNQSVGVDTPGSPLEKHISVTTALELSYDQRSFVIEFAALNLGQSFKPTYCYKLDGFDSDWNCSASGNRATYTNIDPGTYIFLVKASDGEGTWSKTPARVEITIHPSIWKTWWAMALYFGAFALVVYLLARGRNEQVAMKHQLMLERLAREREHELIESKTQFFTNISHEFRTPLSLILMPLESLMVEGQVPPLAKDRIASAYQSANRMMHLVNELMDFNKIESGNLKLDLQYGELMTCIRNISSAFDDLAAKRYIQFTIKDEVPSLIGWFDGDKLEKILVNVLSNAFKFTRDGGEVTIIAREKTQLIGAGQTYSRCLEIVVVDTGMGISKDEIPHIFDKFYQAKSAARIANPGTGIGLSWTKALVELHHGYVTVESIPDLETQFTIVIPIDADVFEIESFPEGDRYTEASQAGNMVRSVSPVPGNTAEFKDGIDILIVEDNDELRNYLSRELGNHFKVLEARDGMQGLEVALNEVPDLIISDILMPGKTGIELCQAIKADVKTSHIPFILLTAKATLSDQIAGIEIGADLYITKPFSILYLLTHVRQLIVSRRRLYARFSQDVYLLPENSASNKLDQLFLERVVDYIHQHLQDHQLTVDSLAEVVNLSRVQVYRKIKALTGKTAVEFIRSVRLKHTLKLMETKQYTLSEVAYRSGFNSASYFTRAFKEEYGKAPSEYMGIPD